MKHLALTLFLPALTVGAAEPFTLRPDLDGDGTAEQVQIAEDRITVTGGKMAGQFLRPAGVPVPSGRPGRISAGCPAGRSRCAAPPGPLALTTCLPSPGPPCR